MFWRVDINIVARSIGRSLAYDVHDKAARGNNWSPHHSALINAVATIKALKRGKTQEASALVARAFDRVGMEVPELGPIESIPVLVKAVTEVDPKQQVLAEQVADLYAEVLRSHAEDTGAEKPTPFAL